jgi:hypothetical protein
MRHASINIHLGLGPSLTTNESSRSEVKKQMFFPFLICSRITAEITTKMDYVMN